MVYLSIYLCHFQFLPSMPYSFQCTDLIPPWLFFPKCFIPFDAIMNGIVFLFSFYDSSFLVYRSAIDFCMLILYPITLLNSFIHSNSFFVEIWELSIYNISSANGDSFTSSFSIWIPFISFSCLTAMARTFNTVLNRSSESGHPCLVPDLRGST